MLGAADLELMVATGGYTEMAIERALLFEEIGSQRDFAVTVMNAVGQGLTVTDAQGRFEFVNPAYARMLGMEPADLLGSCAPELAGPDSGGETHTLGSFETRLLRADARPVPVLVTSVPRWQDGQMGGTIALITDLTPQKRMEEALALARDQALESSRLKSEFLATVSHEIRTPMNSVIGMTELLLDTQLSAEQRELAETVHSSTDALLAIINDILDLSRIEAGKLVLQHTEFDVRAAVKDAAGLLAGPAHEKGLKLSCWIADDVPVKACGDPGRLRQILLNLISNAVKFTDRGQVAVKVSVEPAEAGDTVLRFTVHDTGIGLSDALQARLFEPFTQADGSATRKHGGSGLGLAISKRLVNLMGGEIGVQSKEGFGAAFQFTAHFASGGDQTATAPRSGTIPAPPAARHAQAAGRAGQILLVEDNEVNQRLALRQLARLGYPVDAVYNGQEALATLRDRPDTYALVLMDCQMPVMDGFEATSQIREREAKGAPRLPIIAMTASAMLGDRETCLAAGMDDYISKPVRSEDLRQVVERWLPPALPEVSGMPATQPGACLDRDVVESLHQLALEGEPGALSELVRAFVTCTPEHLGALGAAVTRRDPVAIQRAAHQLRGSSGSFGAWGMAALCYDAENLAAAGDYVTLDGLVGELEGEFVQVKAALESEFPACGEKE